jgi:putrescine importer
MTSQESAVRLKRIFKLRHLILFGLTFVTPTAPFPVFGIVSKVSHGHMALAYLIGMCAMMLTAVSYGRMAAAFPMAGSAYTYSRRTLHPVLGFLTGWMLLLDYVLIPLMSVIYLALTVNHFLPGIPYGLLLVFFAVAITVTNLFGLKVTNRANFAMTAIMAGTVVWVVVAAVRALQAGVGAGTVLSMKPFYNPAEFSLPLVMAGTSIAAFSFLGFDGISTLAEDSENPGKDIGRATILVCFISGLIFMLQAYLGQLVWPDFTSYPRTETAILDVSQLMGGASLLSMVSFVLLVAGVASAVTGQASASRLLYGMGRDRLLPPRIFAYIHPKYSTPTYGILAMGGVTLLGGFWLSFQLAAEAINFGAFFGFMCVNLSVISYYFVKGKERQGADFIRYLVLPIVGFLVCFYIFINLSHMAKLIGTAWGGFGILYAARLTGGFRRKLDTALPEATPEM